MFFMWYAWLNGAHSGLGFFSKQYDDVDQKGASLRRNDDMAMCIGYNASVL
jgi:hypothetical protein